MIINTYSTVDFNSLVKTVINRRYQLNDLLDIWINECSAWTID